MNLFVFWEAINSTALSHDEGCDCRVCRAADGDEDARNELMVELFSGDTPETVAEDE